VKLTTRGAHPSKGNCKCSKTRKPKQEQARDGLRAYLQETRDLIEAKREMRALEFTIVALENGITETQARLLMETPIERRTRQYAKARAKLMEALERAELRWTSDDDDTADLR